MHHRHLARKPLPEPAHRLRGQRYLRDQHDGSLAQGHRPLQRLEVHLRLAAAGDAVQQERPRVFPVLQRLGDAPVRLLLIGGKGGCRPFGVHAVRQRIAHHCDVLAHRQALPLEVAQDGRGQPPRPQLCQGERALVGQRFQHHRPPQGRRPALVPQRPRPPAGLSGGGQQAQMGHHLGPHLGPRQLVGPLDEPAQHQSAHHGADAAQSQRLSQLVLLRLPAGYEVCQSCLLPLRQPQPRQFVQRHQRPQHRQRPALEPRRQHQGNAIEEGRQVVVTEPAGQRHPLRR